MNIKADSFNHTWPTGDFFTGVEHPVFKHTLGTLLIAIDRSGSIVFANGALLAVSGFSENELVGEHYSVLFPKPQREFVKARFVDHQDVNELTSDFSIPLCDSSGESLYIHWDIATLTDPEGAIEYVVGMGTNATEHRNALTSFVSSYARFQHLVEASTDWVWETNSEKRFIYSSPQVESILGYRPDEVIGKKAFDFMPADEVERLTRYFSQEEETAPIDHVLNIKIHKNGRRVTMETSGVPYFSDRGELLGFRGITRDITDQQNVMQALQISEERLRLSQQFANIANWELIVASGQIYCSEHMWVLLGREKDSFELRHQEFSKCVHPDDREMRMKAMNNTIYNGADYDVEYRVIWPNGDIHWLRGVGDVVRDSHGEPLRVLGITTSIDRRKHNERVIIQREEQQRNTLIREVHHRIKNNLQGITGLLRNNLKSSTSNPELAIEKAISQINSIALVHGIHGQRDGRELLLCEMLPAIVEGHVSPAKDLVEIDLSLKIDKPLLVQDSEAVPVALILNELITNALKHANQQNVHDRVSVSLSVVSGRGEVSIHCPGGRLPKGFNFQTGDGAGTGLELVRALLPPKGMSIQYRQTSSGVSTSVVLEGPIVRSYTLSAQEYYLENT